MKRILYSITTTTLLALPFMVGAQGLASGDASGGDFGRFLRVLLEFTNNVLIPFIIGIGFLVFIWGMFWYFIAGGANDEKKEKGRSLMIYATLGFVLIVVFWGVINLITNSLFNRNDIDELDNIPQVQETRNQQNNNN